MVLNLCRLRARKSESEQYNNNIMKQRTNNKETISLAFSVGLVSGRCKSVDFCIFVLVVVGLYETGDMAKCKVTEKYLI